MVLSRGHFSCLLISSRVSNFLFFFDRRVSNFLYHVYIKINIEEEEAIHMGKCFYTVPQPERDARPLFQDSGPQQLKKGL